MRRSSFGRDDDGSRRTVFNFQKGKLHKQLSTNVALEVGDEEEAFFLVFGHTPIIIMGASF